MKAFKFHFYGNRYFTVLARSRRGAINALKTSQIGKKYLKPQDFNNCKIQEYDTDTAKVI